MPRKKVEAITFDPALKSTDLLDGEAAKNILGAIMTVTGYVPAHYIYGPGQRLGEAIESQGVSKQLLHEWHTRWLAEKKDREKHEKLALKKVEDELFKQAQTLTLAEMKPEHIAVLKKRKVF